MTIEKSPYLAPQLHAFQVKLRLQVEDRKKGPMTDVFQQESD